MTHGKHSLYGQESTVSIGLDPEVTSFLFDTFKEIYKNLAKRIRITVWACVFIKNIHCMAKKAKQELDWI
jgi:hypothetical protein